ncbi:MAG: DUF2460 domain-containing protein [Parvibaculaceae bacterium]|nr:DUF2460 domain-containing protein [Parvibaculaceae bacterium]
MEFHDIRFPTRISFGATGGPERRTEVVTLGSGREERNSPWAHSRRRYNAGLGLSTLDDLHDVLAFFEARHGRLYGFRWKDHADFRSGTPGVAPLPGDQRVGTGDGATAAFDLVKLYVSGSQTYSRPIAKPVAGTVRIAVNGTEKVAGTHFTVDTGSGRVTFLAGQIPLAGAAITAGYEFDVPVRFDTDFLEVNISAFKAGSVPNIPVIETRV